MKEFCYFRKSFCVCCVPCIWGLGGEHDLLGLETTAALCQSLPALLCPGKGRDAAAAHYCSCPHVQPQGCVLSVLGMLCTHSSCVLRLPKLHLLSTEIPRAQQNVYISWWLSSTSQFLNNVQNNETRIRESENHKMAWSGRYLKKPSPSNPLP